jgi:hypothetical protein
LSVGFRSLSQKRQLRILMTRQLTLIPTQQNPADIDPGRGAEQT